MTTPEVKRKLTAILNADVKGYSPLMGEDEMMREKIFLRLSNYFWCRFVGVWMLFFLLITPFFSQAGIVRGKIISIRGNVMELDLGIEKGIQLGDSGRVYYNVLIQGEKTPIFIAKFKITKVSDKSSVAQVGEKTEEVEVKAGFLVEIIFKEGELELNSEPPGGKIYVDGKEKGETPSILSNVRLGSHVIRIVKQGYEPYEGQVNVVERERKRISVSLKMAAGLKKEVGTEEGEKISQDKYAKALKELDVVDWFKGGSLYVSKSMIVEVEAFSCLRYDKSRKQTEEEALANAKKKAVEHASTYIKSERGVKDFELEKDLVEAYSNAVVKVILPEISKSWYKDASLGECYQVKVKAEVIPDNDTMDRISKGKSQVDDPSAPLNVQLWMDKKEYKEKDKIHIYIRGNKPFYARVVHVGVKGELLQLLPNPFRQNNFFSGAVIYKIPSAEDQFEMEVTQPFGQENIIVYASNAPLGEINLAPMGGVYEIGTSLGDVGVKSRGVVLQEKKPGEKLKTAEFSEVQVRFTTGK